MYRLLTVGLLSLGALVDPTSAWSQMRIREGRTPPRFAPTTSLFNRGFTFCRVMYDRVRTEAMGMGWVTDYPYAEVNLMSRLAELTEADVNITPEGVPEHFVVRLTDAALYQCPFIMASDAGTIGFSATEADHLRNYLLKGGFLWVDDFWGSSAWEHWQEEIGKALPPGQYTIEELEMDDPIFHNLYEVTRKPQIANLQFWRGQGGRTTSERGSDSQEANYRVIRDTKGRIIVFMTHNTDIADSWEREGEDYGFFYQFAHDGYAVGINVLLHAMTR
jgi:hypothetical protein